MKNEPKEEGKDRVDHYKEAVKNIGQIQDRKKLGQIRIQVEAMERVNELDREQTEELRGFIEKKITARKQTRGGLFV